MQQSPNQGQGYDASPLSGGSPPQQVAAPPRKVPKGFVAGLFDFSFTTFITTRIIKVLYGIYLVLVVLMLLGGLGAGVLTIVAGAAAAADADNYGQTSSVAVPIAMGLAQLVFTVLASVVALIYGRVVFECIAVFFRMAEHLGEIERKTKE